MSKVDTHAHASKKPAVPNQDFQDVIQLIGNDRALKKHLERLKKESPARYRAMTAHACCAITIKDKPCTMSEADELVRDLMAITGWSRARVLCEGMFLFLDLCPIVKDKRGRGHHVLPEDYKAGTSKDDPTWRRRPTFEQVLAELRSLKRAMSAPKKAGK